MSPICELNLAELRDGLRRRLFSAREVTLACIDRLSYTRKLNAFITETPERALTDAARADMRLSKGTAGPLEGIPVGVKDMFCTMGVRTTAASRMLERFVPTYESAVTAKMWQAGAVLFGKTNQDEFAMGSSCLTSAFGPVISPLKGKNDDRDLVPGGSSGGAAAAVASNTVPAALGTDTGGSVRQPASFCGIVGLKPTYGRCSRWGIIAYASSLDQAGVLTRTVRDAAIMLKEMAGGDPRDSTCADTSVPNYESAVGRSIKGMRIGIPLEYRVNGLSPEVTGAWNRAAAALRESGAETVDVSLPLSKYALATYYIIAPAEASSNLARYDGVRYAEC
jgi:aspartyl-tRNA(Asn)/glutamyl-tRNA(Gln) amidotransferase subunit A